MMSTISHRIICFLAILFLLIPAAGFAQMKNSGQHSEELSALEALQELKRKLDFERQKTEIDMEWARRILEDPSFDLTPEDISLVNEVIKRSQEKLNRIEKELKKVEKQIFILNAKRILKKPAIVY